MAARKGQTKTGKATRPSRRAPAKRAPAKTAKDGRPKQRKSPRAAKVKRGAKSVAERTAKAAEAAGAKGAKLPAAKQRIRDSLMAQRAAQGWTNAMIATEAGVSKRTVERILAEMRRLPSPLEQSALTAVRNLTLGLQMSILDFEQMAVSYADVHPSAAVGAKKAANDARRELVAVLQVLGHTPDLGALRVPLEAGQIANAMVTAVGAFEDAIDRLPLDDEQKAAVADAAGNLRTAFGELIGETEEVLDVEVMPELPAG